MNICTFWHRISIRKVGNIHKSFRLYQLFLYIIFYGNLQPLLNYLEQNLDIQRTTGKVPFLFFSYLFLVLTKLLFWEEDWVVGYKSMKF